MSVINRTREVSTYQTWYQFKRDLERRAGHNLPNWDWLEVKPKASLPWAESHLHLAFSALKRLEKQRGAGN